MKLIKVIKRILNCRKLVRHGFYWDKKHKDYDVPLLAKWAGVPEWTITIFNKRRLHHD